jgi:VanZ family protein
MTTNNLTNHIRRRRIFRYAPLVLWIGVIFFASTILGSMSNTSRFIRPLLVFLFPTAPEETLVIYHAYIRKFAHFAEYAILAFFAARAFSTSSVKLLQKFWFVFVFVLVLFVATIDEANQSFNPARTGSIYDILLDAAGGLTMLILYYIYRFRTNIESDNTANC